MNHGRSDSQTLSELRRGLLSSRSAKQQQTRSPPPKKRTPAQVAQARMAWKLRLQKDDRQLRGGEKVMNTRLTVQTILNSKQPMRPQHEHITKQ